MFKLDTDVKTLTFKYSFILLSFTFILSSNNYAINCFTKMSQLGCNRTTGKFFLHDKQPSVSMNNELALTFISCSSFDLFLSSS